MRTLIRSLVVGGVSLVDVYVTAVAFNKKDFWVSTSLTAASNNGIYVRSLSGAAVLDAGVVPGAKVTVIGKVTEGNNDATGDTLTQISRLGVTVSAAPTTPAVPVIGQTVDQLLMNATGEPYESVLVTLTNVKVTMVGTQANFNISDVAQKTTFTGPVVPEAARLVRSQRADRLFDVITEQLDRFSGAWIPVLLCKKVSHIGTQFGDAQQA